MTKGKSTKAKESKAEKKPLLTMEDYEAAGVKPKTVHVLQSGKHSRRIPGTTRSVLFKKGWRVPDLSDAELSAFGDKFLTVQEHEAKWAAFNSAETSTELKAEAAARAREAAKSVDDASADSDDIRRAAELETMRVAELPKQINI